MDVAASPIAFSYSTIVATKSRIDKGLLAIPVSLLGCFPNQSGSVYLLDENGVWSRKSFTALDSSSKESRIGGMRQFYQTYGVKSGDELVVQVYGADRYRILPEALFRERVAQIESDLDEAPTEGDADSAVGALSLLTQFKLDEVIESEYARLATYDMLPRKISTRTSVRMREHIPASLRKILTALYHGRC